jgi:hypothetical protein
MDVAGKLPAALADLWSVLSGMAPYLLFGFLAAGVLSVMVSERMVVRHLGGRGIWPAVKAAAFGVPLPLCSCGVIPVAASLRRQGASRAAATAFLIATPQTGVDSILATYGLLGGVFAIFRPLMALATGVIGGAMVNLAEDDGGSRPADAPNMPDAIAPKDGHGLLYRAMHYGFVSLPRDLGRAMVAGLIVAALISSLVPKNYFSDIVPPGILQILLLMAIGIPVYVCATASVPLAYALILAGVTPGAAFAFLMTGPATNAATIVTVWKVMGRRTAAIYLATMAVAAVLGGLLLDKIVTPDQVVGGHAHAGHWMLPAWIQNAAGVVLIAVLAPAIGRPWLARLTGRRRWSDVGMKLKITGMTCTHCSDRVRTALLACPGVTDAKVDLDSGQAGVYGADLDYGKLAAAVEEAGYGAEPLSRREAGNEG